MLSEASRQRLVRVALGAEAGDLLIRDARVVSALTGEVYGADVVIAGGVIAGVGRGYRARDTLNAGGAYLAPGFMDAHIHIESSFLTPARFAEAVLPRGTTAVVAEPHEIANVLGVPGVAWMLDAGRASGLRVFASMPSCVPASAFEQGGASVGAAEVEAGLRLPGVLGLAEMMNYPGVLGGDEEVWAVLGAARGARLDGHAAGLSGRSLQAYAAAGLHSDHEAVTPDGARERLRAGLWLMVREGSAARNLQALLPVLRERPRRAMLVSDDVSVDELLDLGHLDRLLRACVAGGVDALYALGLVTHAPAEYWGLTAHGAVAPGYAADLVLLDDLVEFRVRETLVGGVVARGGGATPPLAGGGTHLGPDWAGVPLDVPAHWPTIGVSGDQIETRALPPGQGDTKLVVAERHAGVTRAAAAFARGVGLRSGALSLSVLHDAHHAIIAGATDAEIRAAGRALEAQGGGAVFVERGEVVAAFPLPLAGLMTDAPPAEAARAARAVSEAARARGCPLPQPLTTLSFLGLTVIPELKLTPQGLFDVRAWALVE
ncbi:adenine deaminase [Deinococcus maricopensis]|uniref:Adenine deaminase n=1 Tax=Deinococcus maricopensis (strain DSM 21211 / LMG 22137 / NRRL B-23946 / LB-34) TaxID=709986 RepID=E8U4J4_DEIML|nr:adenine deaminase C-terminal domain-containing protein [Deinococcus maricopensis]ADV68859.1 Adenine deaminase [Deinococcus maricopensis DSM 21211]